MVCFIDCALGSDLRSHWNRQGHEDMCFLMDLETTSNVRLSESGLRHHLGLISYPMWDAAQADDRFPSKGRIKPNRQLLELC